MQRISLIIVTFLMFVATGVSADAYKKINLGKMKEKKTLKWHERKLKMLEEEKKMIQEKKELIEYKKAKSLSDRKEDTAGK